MAILISYDIEDNYLRQKVANYIIDAGLDRIQYSVYLGTIKENAIPNLLAWCQQLAKHPNWQQNDSLLIISLSTFQIQQMLIIGNPKWDRDDLSGDKHTLIL